MIEKVYSLPESLIINYRGFVVYCKRALISAGSGREMLEVDARL